MPSVYLGLGSNLGNRSQNISNAHHEIFLTGKFELIKMSAVEETAPVDYLEQPYFLNQVILTNTDMLPLKVLKVLQKIEKKLGRKKTIPKGPRIIDIDILLYDDYVIKSQILTIPHPEITNRNFVLKHLLEIDPDLTDPLTKIPYSDYYKNFTGG